MNSATSHRLKQKVASKSALPPQSTWGNIEKSQLPAERPLTNAELLAKKLVKAELAEEAASNRNDSILQPPIPPPSDATQWPSLGESRLIGARGKNKKGTKEGPKLGGTTGPKADQGPDAGSGSRTGLTNPSTRLSALDNTNRNAGQSSQQINNESKDDINSRHGQNADPKSNSYFASTGSAPLAKEKDSLAKLFEKYRGKHLPAFLETS